MRKGMSSRHLPLIATVLVLAILFTTASLLYPRFFSWRVVVNLFGGNAFLGITAVGMTFVILSGGIDLSVGAVVAFTTIFVATLTERHGLHPLVVLPLALLSGTLNGATMGFLIQRYKLPAFLVTLAGMFFARGMAFLVNPQSLGITHPFYRQVLDFGIPLGHNLSLRAPALIFLAVVGLGIFLTNFTRFGRNVYAVGGSEASAQLMGLPVTATKVGVYALSGLFAALAGIVATFDMGSGNPANTPGLELDAIAAVVIGGTLLSGGVGSIAGTLTGVLIFGTIQTALTFDGRLNSWWLRIAIGVLLLLFILLQRFLTRRTE